MPQSPDLKTRGNERKGREGVVVGIATHSNPAGAVGHISLVVVAGKAPCRSATPVDEAMSSTNMFGLIWSYEYIVLFKDGNADAVWIV